MYTTDVDTYDIADIVHNKKQMMTVINENNEEEEVEVILAYIDQKTNLVSSSKVDRTGETVKLVGMSDEEWERVQQVLSELANSDV